MCFDDDESIECEQCGCSICAGERYLIYSGQTFCSDECIKDYLFDLAVVDEGYLKTAEDKEFNLVD